MPVNQYPAFEGGQTLTSADLNLVRDFLHDRDRLLGRITGFGTNCGLGGTIAGTTLTVSPGLAVDQVGEPLLLGTATPIPLPPAPSAGTFDFVEAAPGGYTIVLEATDAEQVPPDCGETGCEGHATVHTRSVALRAIPGRVTSARFAFASEPLLAVTPMRLSTTSNPQGSFVTLRNALTSRLAGHVDSGQLARLAAISIESGDLPGERGYKAGFLNQVLFAALDLLRCQALMAVSCDRTTARPGVALGWVVQSGGAWQWHCEYRHAWEPPRGLTSAMLGGSCSDPCRVHREHLEGLLASYVEPEPPATPPSGGGGTVEPGDFVYCPHGMIRVGNRCINVIEPPVVIPDRWADPWVIDPLGPIWNPPFETNPWEVYEIDPLDYLGSGVLNILPSLGLPATQVEAALDERITDVGGTPNISVLTMDEASGLAGYAPASAVSPADQVVLVADATGRVVATGRVAAARTARAVGTQLPAAIAAADSALEATTGLRSDLAEVGAGLGEVRTDVQELKGFTQEMGTWRAGVDGSIAGVPAQVERLVGEQVGGQFADMQRRVATMEGAIDILRSTSGGRPVAGGVREGLGTPFAEGMIEYVETLTAGLRTLVNPDNQDRLGRYVEDTSRAAAKLEVAIAAGEPRQLEEAALEVLDSMRTAIKSAGVPADVGRQVDAQFRMMRDIIR